MQQKPQLFLTGIVHKRLNEPHCTGLTQTHFTQHYFFSCFFAPDHRSLDHGLRHYHSSARYASHPHCSSPAGHCSNPASHPHCSSPASHGHCSSPARHPHCSSAASHRHCSNPASLVAAIFSHQLVSASAAVLLFLFFHDTDCVPFFRRLFLTQKVPQ